MTLYKILNEDGTPYWGGKGKWHLPKCGKPGKWMPPIKDISLCEHGYHVLKPEMLLYWLGPVIFEVEVHGAEIWQDDKGVVEQARLVRKLSAWNEQTARLLACDYAEAVQDVLTGSFELIKRAPIVESAIAAWRQITLTEAEQQSFAEQALTLRYPEGSPITAEKALRVRRYDDNGSDLWHVFNRVQEAVVRGGDRYYNNGRRNKTREVRGIDQNINLNRSLWSLAEQVAISKM